MTVFIFLAAILVLIAIAPLLAELTRRGLSGDRLRAAPGEIAHLPGGPTHYTWSGPEDGPIMVCIHGLSTPSFVFAATERSLAAQGYRVLTYDLYGRGFSAQPRGKQDGSFFKAQLRQLLKHLEVTDPISLLGFSMGAQIAAAFAAEEVDLVDELVLIAPAGLAAKNKPGPSPIWTAPLIGDWMTVLFGGIALRRELVEHRNLATVVPNFEDLQAAETQKPGFLPALLSSRRHMLGRMSDVDYQRIARADIPVLAIWGEEDPVVPVSAVAILARAHPDAHHVQIPGAGHNLLQTHPREVAEALKAFTS